MLFQKSINNENNTINIPSFIEILSMAEPFSYQIEDGIRKVYLTEGCMYSGEIKNGKLEGKGTLLIPFKTFEKLFPNSKLFEAKVNNSLVSIFYIGEFKNNLMDGYGKITNFYGTSYEGSFKNGLTNGHGIFFHGYNSSYAGNWRNGLKHGDGVLKIYGAKPIKGKWVDDKLIPKKK